MNPAASDAPEYPIRPLAPIKRGALIALAFAGSTMYALFYGWLFPAVLYHRAAVVGIAAGSSWLIFGCVLLGVSGRLPSESPGSRVLNWMDASLIAIAWGMGVKMMGLMLNVYLLAVDSVLFHAAVQIMTLLAADVLMGIVFVHRARELGVSLGRGITLWLMALNLPFALILTFLLMIGGV
ncbi:MAG: hypothetical protein WD768_20315 [Phycisphaeraceae bacterium]